MPLSYLYRLKCFGLRLVVHVCYQANACAIKIVDVCIHNYPTFSKKSSSSKKYKARACAPCIPKQGLVKTKVKLNTQVINVYLEKVNSFVIYISGEIIKKNPLSSHAGRALV